MTRLNARDAGARAARLASAEVAATDFSEALSRGLRVLTAFDQRRQRMTLAEVAAAVSLPRATARRALLTLVHLGYVSVEDRTYQLTPRVLELATGYLLANPLSVIVQPACERICAQAGASCTVAVLDRGDAVMIARAVPRNPLFLGTGVGYRVPALHSALGRVLLAGLDDTEREAFLDSVPAVQLTPQTVTDKAELRTLIEKVRSDGFAYVDREAETGFHSVAVPLQRWDGRPVAAINIGTHVDRVDRTEMLGPMLATLRTASADLRRQLI